MAELTPAPGPEQIGSDESYRPLSGLAIAGLGLAVLFAAIVTAYGVVGLISGMPVLLDSWHLLLLPIGGAVLSVLAQRQIRKSEGTRAGTTLATWGLWLSVLFGLGYGAYAVGTNLAVRWQAEKFLLEPNPDLADVGFFAKLKDPNPDKLIEAFLLTRPPDLRTSFSPGQEAEMERRYNRPPGPGRSGELSMFRDNPIVRIVRQAGPDAEIRLHGVMDCKYEEGGYWVDLSVEIKTPDHVVVLPFTVRSKDSPSSKREWFVDWTRVPRSFDVSWGGITAGRGETVFKLRMNASLFFKRWTEKLNKGETTQARKDLCGPAKPVWQAHSLDRIEKEKRAEIRRQVEQLLDPTARDRPLAIAELKPANLLSYWEIDKKKDRLRITQELQFRAVDTATRGFLFSCEVNAVIERTDGGKLTFDSEHPPSWCITRLEVVSVADQASGRGPPGGGRS